MPTNISKQQPKTTPAAVACKWPDGGTIGKAELIQIVGASTNSCSSCLKKLIITGMRIILHIGKAGVGKIDGRLKIEFQASNRFSES